MLIKLWGPTTLIALGGFISLFGTIWAAKEQADSELQSRLKSEKTLAFLEGSHSFEIKKQFSKIGAQEILTIFIKNIGEFPSYNVTFRAIDVDAYGFEEIQDMADILKKPSPIYEKEFADIAPLAMGQGLSISLLPGKSELHFKIFLSSRKGISSYKIMFKKNLENGQWN